MSSFMSPNFIIGSIRIGSVESASCINMGNNWPTGFESTQKTVQGFGSVAGDHNQIVGTRSLLNDSDFLDMLNIEGNETPEWLQEIIVNSSEAAGFSIPEDTPSPSEEEESSYQETPSAK
ncbi:hypothetical protein [Paenibacillus hexagrammi]|uniref:Spore germination protein GerPA/GerPF n=1 Tax=Paenibacillus hexagrammi TaxID=2908839 RepID=A0ABY3SK56_9BACL|nr:hypothetical protein [Paenibacillus sp. YPD9-1]UJF34346.1 hypothetical protein L0M14_03810 [Paenibacillus sp. YPD9-1]